MAAQVNTDFEKTQDQRVEDGRQRTERLSGDQDSRGLGYSGQRIAWRGRGEQGGRR